MVFLAEIKASTLVQVSAGTKINELRVISSKKSSTNILLSSPARPKERKGIILIFGDVWTASTPKFSVISRLNISGEK